MMSLVIDSIISASGPIFFIVMQISLLSSALHDIIREKNEKKLSPIPFFTLFVNCYVWTLYAYLTSELSLLLPEALGVIVGLFCVISYGFYSTQTIPVYVISISLLIITAGSLCTAFMWLEFLGMLCMCLSIALTASPLAAIRQVIKQRCTDAMPLSTSLSAWCSSLAWSLYGVRIVHDVMVYTPAALGLFLATFQLVLHIIYNMIPAMIPIR